MRARLITAVAVTALATLSPATAGSPNDATYRGRCFLAAVNDTTQVANPPDYWWGYVGAAVVTMSPTVGHNPVAALVRCELLVNAASTVTAFTGTAVTAGVAPVSFTATVPPDTLTLCTHVKTTDAHLQVATFSSCVPVNVVVAPPQEVVDVANDLCAALGDTTVCDVLAANRGNVAYAV